MIAAVQLLYWGVVSPPAQRADLSEFQAVATVDVAPLDIPTLEAVAAIDEFLWQEQEIFWYGCCDQTHYAFRYRIAYDESETGDLGLIASFGSDNYHVWINGHPIIDEGRLSPLSTYHARWARGVQRVPKAMLNDGLNEVVIITARNHGGYTDLFPQIHGPYDAMVAATATRTFMLNDFRIATLITFGLVALVLTILVTAAWHKELIVWFAILTWGLTLRLGYYRWWDPPLTPELITAYYFCVINLVAIAWLNFVRTWCDESKPWITKTSIAAGIGVSLISTILILLDKHEGYLVADKLSQALGIGAGILAGYVLLEHMYKQPAHRPLEASILFLGLTTMVADSASELLWQHNLGALQFAQPVLVVSFIVALLTRNLRAFEESEKFNALLNTELGKREHELEQKYEELRQVDQERQVQEERQRILRDVHDGIGSRLTGLIIQARNESIQMAGVRNTVEDCLNELHLVINSLDYDQDQPHEIFNRLQSRFEQQANAADVDIEWCCQHPQTIHLSRTGYLHLVRIIQEAMTNVFRHSDAKAVRVTSTEEHERYTLEVADNGSSIDPKAFNQGSGIKSMQYRATQIGGALIAESTERGFRVCLTLDSSVRT